jgi:molybdate transport system substrate-binding protein
VARTGRHLLVMVMLALASSCRTREDGGKVLVLAAISVSDALKTIAAEYERTTGTGVVLSTGGSNVLARQIEEGAAADLFISADRPQMERLVNAGLVDPSDRIDLLSNQLVVVVPADRPAKFAGAGDLAAPGIRRIALGDPAAVPAGVYARAWLKQAGVWDAVRTRVVPSGHVRAALVAVEEGHADAAVVYRTDVRPGVRVQVAYVVPPGDAPPIVYPAAVLKRAPHRAAALSFLTYLRSPAARSVFSREGFGEPPS